MCKKLNIIIYFNHNSIDNMNDEPQITEALKKNISERELQDQYLNSLCEKDRKGYEIAKSHLGMSFQLEKSLGFLEYKKSMEQSDKK